MTDRIGARLVGVELYYYDMPSARRFYGETLGLALLDEDPERYVRFDTGPAFVCLERMGVESYPSRGKAVLFFEVPNLTQALETIGRSRVVQLESAPGSGRPPWAVLHDPEGYNVVLIEGQRGGPHDVSPTPG